MSFSLKDRGAVVTGAASGIGLAIARRFLGAGAKVVGIDCTPQGNEPFPCLVADIGEAAQLEAALGRAEVLLGGPPRILVNNAGIQPLGIAFADLTPALIHRTLAVNVAAVALGLRYAAQRMEGGSRVLNTGSFVGLLGVPLGSIYAASKAAVIHLTRLGALELAAKAITVNCICPGTILTPAVTDIPRNPEIPFVTARTPLGRLGKADEVAAAFHFLASEDAAYITGAVLAVDGGISAGWERYEVIPPPQFSVEAWKS